MRSARPTVLATSMPLFAACGVAMVDEPDAGGRDTGVRDVFGPVNDTEVVTNPIY